MAASDSVAGERGSGRRQQTLTARDVAGGSGMAGEIFYFFKFPSPPVLESTSARVLPSPLDGEQRIPNRR